MESRALVNVVDNLNSESAVDALSANQGRVLKEMIDNVDEVTVVDNLSNTSATSALSAKQGKILNDKITSLMVRDISGLNLNTLIGELIIGYGNDCINKPSGNGFLLNIPHPTAPTTYNRQYWQVRTNNCIYTRHMESGVWSNWVLIVS